MTRSTMCGRSCCSCEAAAAAATRVSPCTDADAPRSYGICSRTVSGAPTGISRENCAEPLGEIDSHPAELLPHTLRHSITHRISTVVDSADSQPLPTCTELSQLVFGLDSCHLRHAMTCVSMCVAEAVFPRCVACAVARNTYEMHVIFTLGSSVHRPHVPHGVAG